LPLKLKILQIKMKNFKTLALASLMIGATATSLTSCKGGEEEIKQDSGLGMVKFLVQQTESAIKFDETKKEDIAKIFEVTADDEYMSGKKEFKENGYYVSKNFSMYEGTLQSISYDSFYDDGKEDAAKKDAEEIKTFLNEKLGKSSDSYGETTTWKKDKYSIDFTIYSNGWGFYLRSNREVVYEDEVTEGDTEGCEGKVGDFYGLLDDLTAKLINNLKDGKIALGKTTEAEITAIFGDATSYSPEFDGIRLSGYFTYEGGKLSSVRYDYFYDCESAKNMLNLDKSDIKAKIDGILGASTTSGSGEFESYNWTAKGYTVSQSNFSDGYAFSVN
jgi:hypothetical protein